MAGRVQRRWGSRLVLVFAVLAVAVLDSASGDSADNSGTAGAIPPSVFVSQPEDRSFVNSSSFEISGGLGGSVQDIDVFLDGALLGPARRVEGEPSRWRFPGASVSVTPGHHLITVRATGEGGTSSATAWIYYDTGGRPFVMIVEPEQTTYQQGDTAIADDPDLLLFGPADDPVTLDMSTSAPPQIRSSVNDRLSTGSLASLDVDIRDDAPGEYPVVVRAVAPDGTEEEATHTIVIVGEPVDPEGTARILSDDFEGGTDRWSTVTSGTNGATDIVSIQGGYRRMQHVLPGTTDGEGNPTQITVVHLFEGGTWDPAVDGALSHINYSEDRIEQDPPFDGAAVGALFILEQDGTRYFVSLDESNAFTNTAWESKSLNGLTPGDFSPSAPDFSASGGEMVFGILRSNTNRSDIEIVITHGLDNWRVELVGE